MAESYLDRKERLRGEGKVELPLNIDTKKYLIANISYQDLLIVSPFLVFSLILIYVFYKLGLLSQSTVVISLSPTAFMLTLQLIKHPVRKNISFIKFNILWRLSYNKRQKEFYYRKGEIEVGTMDDVRKKLGIKAIFSGAYETIDNHFVKVIEVSSVNLSLMNETELNNIYNAYRSFLNELNTKHIQIAQIAQPVNLSHYLLYVERQTENEQDHAKRMLKQSYKSYIENIQKSRNMVQRKRYIIIRTPINNDREKALQEVERTAVIIQSKIENMLSGQTRLTAKTLHNDELIRLIHTCLDYENSLAQGDRIVDRAKNKMDVSMGEKTAKEVLKMFERKLYESIN